MSGEEEVPQDIQDPANNLMMLKNAKPTAEECMMIRIWRITAAELSNRLNSTVPLVRNRKIGRSFDVGTKARKPFWLARFIRNNNGVVPKMIIQKIITATDINSNHGRLSMPFSQIDDLDFLTEDEEIIIEDHFNKVGDKGVDATVVDCEQRRWEVNLRKWGMTNGNFLYNLVTGWNKVVEELDLEKDEEIRLWSFHSSGRLFFALVILPPEEEV